MKSWLNALLLIVACSLPTAARAQSPEVIKGADDRYKGDILIVVAHPDDEGFFAPYAAKAIYDMHKRVAVIFTTHGGSGMNHYSRERGPAMANEREIEARDACARLGISNVWFLDGKDTRSQDVLASLSSWGHGSNLEQLVGLIRLTRPEVIFTHLPGVFIGENHSDHQATGVLVTEAFDLAADPTVFPSQLAVPLNRDEIYLANMLPWQPRKLYFASDADDQKQFNGTGPTYSVREVSPSKKLPYSVLALKAALPHRTQFPGEIDHFSKMSDEEIAKMLSDPKNEWWPDPSTLIFGKSAVDSKPTDDVFSHLDQKPRKESSGTAASCGDRPDQSPANLPFLGLGGSWYFYKQFYPAHGLCQLPVAKVPEIGIQAGSTLVVPLVIHHDPAKALAVALAVNAPANWKVQEPSGQFLLPAEESTSLVVHIDTPKLSAAELKNAASQDVRVSAQAEGKSIGEVILHVVLKSSALPQ